MQQIYWLGGSPCAGKTTISHIIAQEFGWQTYHIDREVESYLARADSQKQPHLSAYKEMGLKRFLLQAAQVQLDMVLGMSQEQYQFILEDLAKFEEGTTILVEGANLHPQDVASVLPSTSHALWLVPTEEFQLEVYPKRGTWVQDVLRNFEDDTRVDVFEQWMERDAMMARWMEKAASDLGIRVITVDGSASLLDNAETVMKHFGLLE
jgi:adenylate kinase family enzyme